MPDPNDKPIDASGAPSATDLGDQNRIVDDLPGWRKAIDSLTDPALKEALSKKIEAYDRRFTEKMTGLSRREQEIAKVAENLKVAASTSPARGGAATRAEGQKVLDALMETAADPAAREGIRQLRDAIREETDIEKLKETVARLEQRLQQKEDSETVVRKQSFPSEVKKLEELYGPELVGKYRDQLEANILKYPEYSARRWLHTLADPDELDQALRIHLKKGKSDGQEPPKKPESPPVTSTKPSPVSDRYRGKTTAEQRVGLSSAISDSVKEALGKLSLGGR